MARFPLLESLQRQFLVNDTMHGSGSDGAGSGAPLRVGRGSCRIVGGICKSEGRQKVGPLASGSLLQSVDERCALFVP